MALRPSWAVYHQLGVTISRHLDPNHTYEEIGAAVGLSKQQAYHEAMVALGKVAYQLKQQFREAH